MQKFGNVSVDLLDDRRDLEWSVLDRLEHLALAQFAMRNILLDFSFGIFNYRTVGGIDLLDVERKQTPQRIHVLPEVTGFIRNYRGPRSQHYVTGEERFFFHQVIAKMVGCMAGRKDGAQRPTLGRNHPAMVDHRASPTARSPSTPPNLPPHPLPPPSPLLSL